MRHGPGILAVCLLTLAGLPARAVTVTTCDGLASVQSIAEPWEANTRTFANGDIRLVVLDTIEPAAGAFHLAILHPPRDELGSPMCSQIALPSWGFVLAVGLRCATA